MTVFTYCAIDLSGVFTSSDGIAWVSRAAFPKSHTLASTAQQLVSGPDMFVAGAASNSSPWTSPDGITWTSRSGGPGNVAAPRGGWYSPERGLYVFGNTDDGMGTSPDGIIATSRSNNIGAGNHNWGVAYSPTLGIFASVSNGGYANSSSDGITWISRSNIWGNRVVAWGNSVFCAMGAAAHTTSANGTTWTSRAVLAPDFFAMLFDGTKFVAAGTLGFIGTSTDGITFVSRAAPAALTWSALCLGNGLYLAGDNAGRIFTSADAITWTSRAKPGTGVSGIAMMTHQPSLVIPSNFISSGGEAT